MPAQPVKFASPRTLNLREIESALTAGEFLSSDLKLEKVVKSHLGILWIYIRKLLWMATGYRLERLIHAIGHRVLREYVDHPRRVARVFLLLQAKVDRIERLSHRQKLAACIVRWQEQYRDAQAKFVYSPPRKAFQRSLLSPGLEECTRRHAAFKEPIVAEAAFSALSPAGFIPKSILRSPGSSGAATAVASASSVLPIPPAQMPVLSHAGALVTCTNRSPSLSRGE